MAGMGIAIYKALNQLENIMDKDIASIEKEFSKVWMENNPELFTKRMLDFLNDHNSSEWKLSTDQTTGFFRLKATRLTRG